ncbi:phosphotriesterase [Aeromicrobium tamlense]|uniref:Phosphotriesterase n=1 Tax=Aeromicrobium tamlense TaxID=375541 RepID=A0A8I0FXV1_9ACTN|nr:MULTISPECIES: phosphotriesterase [Aeromicrobium]MBD1269907.1 phosphotriesterase [Aeromicrobium tamlense]NYI39436.1 phosphotriesterase-related protein [Aeromicrobium tamlense]
MATVQTVKGPIDSSELGRTLVHEHVFVLGEEFRINYDGEWDEDQKVADAVRDLNDLKAAGIDTIFDPTVLGLGRYIPRIQKVAAQTDLNIVVATGLYTYNDLPHQFEHRGPGLLFDQPEPLVEMFVKDITEGILDTGVKAAFLKCVIEEPGLTPGVERVMRAVGQTSSQTGAPVTVHTNPHTRSGLVAQKVLGEEGVAPEKIVLGHSGDSDDVDYLTELAENGSLLGMDRFGLDVYLSTEKRVDTIVELVRRGFVDKITLAHDASCYIDYFTPEDKVAMQPNWNFRHIPDDVVPMLLEKGVSEDDVDTMLVKNPRRYFE